MYDDLPADRAADRLPAVPGEERVMRDFAKWLAIAGMCFGAFLMGLSISTTVTVKQIEPKLCDCNPCKCQVCKPCPADRDPAVGAEDGDSIVSIDGEGVIVRRFRWCDGRRTNSVIRLSHDEFRRAYRFLPLGRVGEEMKGVKP